MTPLSNLLGHFLYFVRWTAVIVALGAVVGAFSFPLVGLLIGAESTVAELALSGARKLAFLAFVWAPGTALVLTFHRLYLARQRHASVMGETQDANPAG
ncbi:hypothetical protein ASA1KI_22190 [Opitutales bacterium ASA1]|uniref:hypothetical protein n=1 Tax=Congregicoccus parvus TaxID=3081749 RepID=UPI002B28EB34|nr:hypothetical protein ASA1KI_22190 [Opitutales bacterium ASA1]